MIRHQLVLKNLIVVFIIAWYISGMLLVDMLHVAIFAPVWAAIGLIIAFWAWKW